MNAAPPDGAELRARMDALGRAVRGEDPDGSILQLTEEMVVSAPAVRAGAPDAAVEPIAAAPQPAPDPLPSAAAAALLLPGKGEEERPSPDPAAADLEALVRAEIRAWLAEHGADILRQVTEGAPAGTERTTGPG